MPNKLVNVGLHAEMLMFKSEPDPTKPLLTDKIQDKTVITQARQNHITGIGIDLSYSEQRALFAVQKLLDDTNFKGNTKPNKMPSGNPYKMKGDQPVLNVRISQYLDAYGVKKSKSSRGKNEYSAQGRRSALNALKSLAKKKFLLSYRRNKYDPKKPGVIKRQDQIEVVDSLVEVGQGSGRLKITPSPILFDQHDTYYMILPTDLYTSVATEKQKSHILFHRYLFYHYEKIRSGGGTKRYSLTRRMEVIGHAIGLGNLIRTRQLKKLRETLNRYYELAKKKSFLVNYETNVPGARHERVDKLHIKASTMAAMRKV